MAMAVMLFTSCLKNEEPQSLGTLREAKAELIKAQAAYKTAEIALIQAQVAYNNAVTEGVKVANELQAQKVEAQKIENKIREVALALEEAKLEAEIAKLETELARQEAALAAIQQQMELAAAQHEEAMIAAMKAIAEAQQAYEEALKKIEAENIGLTDAQTAVLKEYTSKIKELEQNIYQQQQAYAQKYAEYQRLLLTNTYEDILQQAEWALEAALTDANEIVEDMDDIVAFFEAETTQELVEQAAAEEAVIALYEDSLAMYDAELDVIKEERITIKAEKDYAIAKYVAPYQDSVDTYYTDFTTVWNKYVGDIKNAVDKKVNATFTYDPALEEYMSELFPEEAENGKYTSTSTFSIIEEKTAAAFDRTKYTYSYAYQNSADQAKLLALYDDLYVAVYSELHISPAVVEQMLNNAEANRSLYNETKEAYEELKPIFDAAIETVPVVAAEYGIGEEDDMQTLTAELYEELIDDYTEEEQIENTRWAEVLEAVVAYLEARVELDGQQVSWTEDQKIGEKEIEVVVTLQEKLQNKYATEKDLLVEYYDEINYALNDVERVRYGKFKVLEDNNGDDLPIEDQPLLLQWNYTSAVVYGTDGDKPLQMPIEKYFQDFSAVTVNADGKIVQANRADEVAMADFEKMAASFGWEVVDASETEIEENETVTIPFYRVKGFEDGLWFLLQMLTEQLNPEVVELQEEVGAVLAAIDAQKVAQPAAVKAAADAVIANTAKLDAAIADLKAADKALADATKQYTASYDAKLKELDKEEEEIKHQKGLINIKLKASKKLHRIYMSYINEYVVEDGTVVNVNPQTVAEFVCGLQDELYLLQQDYSAAMIAVAACEEHLEMVKLGIDQASVALAEKIASYEFDLERIEEEIAEYTIALEYYQELLAEAIETFIAE